MASLGAVGQWDQQYDLVIAGFGPRSYELAVRAALDLARRAGAKG